MKIKMKTKPAPTVEPIVIDETCLALVIEKRELEFHTDRPPAMRARLREVKDGLAKYPEAMVGKCRRELSAMIRDEGIKTLVGDGAA